VEEHSVLLWQLAQGLGANNTEIDKSVNSTLLLVLSSLRSFEEYTKSNHVGGFCYYVRRIQNMIIIMDYIVKLESLTCW